MTVFPLLPQDCAERTRNRRLCCSQIKQRFWLPESLRVNWRGGMAAILTFYITVLERRVGVTLWGHHCRHNSGTLGLESQSLWLCDWKSCLNFRLSWSREVLTRMCSVGWLWAFYYPTWSLNLLITKMSVSWFSNLSPYRPWMSVTTSQLNLNYNLQGPLPTEKSLSL